MVETHVTRKVETELPVEDLWALVADGDAWATWMVDAAAVEVTPGATGSVVDGGVERAVRIDRLGPAELTFTWWPEQEPGQASTVELVVIPTSAGSTLHITERYPTSATANANANAGAMAWDVRTLLLVLVLAGAASTARLLAPSV